MIRKIIKSKLIGSLSINNDYLISLAKGPADEARSVANLTIEAFKEVIPNLKLEAVDPAVEKIRTARLKLIDLKICGAGYNNESLEAVTEALEVGHDLIRRTTYYRI